MVIQEPLELQDIRAVLDLRVLLEFQDTLGIQEFQATLVFLVLAD